MAVATNGTVVRCTVDTSVSPPLYGARVHYDTPPPSGHDEVYTNLASDHYINLLRALGTVLKVDVTTDAANNVTGTAVHA